MRWTIKKLDSINEVDFAIAILNERKNKLSNSYSPLSQKINKTINKLEDLKR